MQRDGLRNFVTVPDRKFNILAGMPNGSIFGDIRFSFSFRPHDDTFRLEMSLHTLTGGSRRFRKDMLHNIKVAVTQDKIEIVPTYVRDKKYEEIRHMTSAPRDHGEGLPPFEEIKAGSYDLPKNFRWQAKRWQPFEIALDQHVLSISSNGRELVRHEINPGAGSLNMNSFGGVDFADFEIREIRPAFDPYHPDNLLTEKSNPIRTKPIEIPPADAPVKAAQQDKDGSKPTGQSAK